MSKWIVCVVCVVLVFAAIAVAKEEKANVDEGMISSGNILILINGSPNFAAGYGSLKVEPDEGEESEGNVLMFSAGGRLGFFIQKSFAFGAFGSLAYAKAESEVGVPGVEMSFEDPVTLTAITLGPWVGYFVDLNSWFIPYVGIEAGLNYTKIDDKNTDSTTTIMLLGADLIAGALFNFAGNWALDIELDMSPADLRTLTNSFAVGLAVSF